MIKEIYRSKKAQSKKFIIIGCGSAGINDISSDMQGISSEIKTIGIDLDACRVKTGETQKKLWLGKKIAKGFGAGGNPEVAKMVAENEGSLLQSLISTGDICLITAGLGGGTGSGIAPVISRIAHEKGAHCLGLFSTPLLVEKRRVQIAYHSLEKLPELCSTIIFDLEIIKTLVLPDSNSNIIMGSLYRMHTIKQEIIRELLYHFTDNELIKIIPVEYEDLIVLLDKKGLGTVCIGESSEPNRVQGVVRNCLSNLFCNMNVLKASGILILITGGYDLDLFECHVITDTLTQWIDIHTDVVYGARVEKRMEGKIRVMMMIMGT